MSMETQSKLATLQLESKLIPTREGTFIKSKIPLSRLTRIHSHFNNIVIDLCNGQFSDDGKQGVAFMAEFLKDLQLNELQVIRGVLPIEG